MERRTFRKRHVNGMYEEITQIIYQVDGVFVIRTIKDNGQETRREFTNEDSMNWAKAKTHRDMIEDGFVLRRGRNINTGVI